jgi:hypothetical protein
MTLIHGKSTVVIVNAVDLSQFVKTSEFTRGKDLHDTTHYGDNEHEYSAGLGDNAFSMGGTYDNTAGTGPRAVLRPLADSGAPVTLVRRPEGTGAGKAQDSVTILVEKYVETNPVADMVAWSAECKCSGAVNSAAQ